MTYNQAEDFPTLYNPREFSKDRAIARLPDKVNPIIRLTAQHKQVIALHMSGWSGVAIGRALKRPASWVYGVLRDDRVKHIISKMHEMVDAELAALFPKAVDAVRTVVEHGTYNARLRAAELIFKTQDKLAPEDSPTDGAEDIIARMLARVEVEGKAIVTIGVEAKPRHGAGG